MGYMGSMDEKGDAQGNYTVIARSKHTSDGSYGLYQIGTFLMPDNATDVPVSIDLSNQRSSP
jgi:atrial natriuretic peptide receptor A